MTVAFETFIRPVLGGNPWSDVLDEYNELSGRIWILVPLWTLFEPYVFFRCSERGRQRR